MISVIRLPAHEPHSVRRLHDSATTCSSPQLAHPHLYDHLGVKLLRSHKADGLVGVEAFYATYDSRERARWVDLADELDLVCTAGSDSHDPTTPHGVDVPADRSARLVDWLGAPPTLGP